MLKRFGLWLLVALLVSGVSTASSMAFGVGQSNFGSRWWPVSGAPAYGGNTSMVTPTGLSVPAGELILFRSVFEGLNSSGTDWGLIQGGFYRSGTGFQLDNCGVSPTATRFYFEWDPAGTLNAYTCSIPGTATSGVAYGLPVWHADGAGEYASIYPYGGSSIGAIGPLALHFTSGIHGVGGEINGNDGNNGAHGSAAIGTAFAWQVFKGPGMSQAGTVQNCANTWTHSQSAGWTIPCPPTPFTNSH